MNKTEKQIAQAASKFAKRWQGKGYEKGESQVFWLELLTEVFGISEPSTFISFEDQVHLDHTSFIDGYIDHTHTMIEQQGQRIAQTAQAILDARALYPDRAGPNSTTPSPCRPKCKKPTAKTTAPSWPPTASHPTCPSPKSFPASSPSTPT